jgi:uncharacterized protein YcfL
MKTLFVIVLITFGLMVGCASREQIDQQNELVREHQTPKTAPTGNNRFRSNGSCRPTPSRGAESSIGRF